MNRSEWRDQRRLWNEVQMDTLYAQQYDEHWGHINPSHHAILEHFLDLCPSPAAILDAACGTGKYWSMLLEHKCSIVGTDQSQQMLAHAHKKFPDVPIHHIGIQEITFSDTFDGVMCMDAMEMVFPEDWPIVLNNFANALHMHGYLYFTVELETQEALQVAYDAGKRLGLPIISGEYAHHGGYHYYPTDEQVRNWLTTTSLAIVECTEGDGYRHYVNQKINDV